MKKIIGIIIVMFFSGVAYCQPLSRSVFKASQYIATDTIKSVSGNGINVWNNRVTLLANPINPQDAVNLRSLTSTLNAYKLTQPNDTVQSLSGTAVTWDCSRGVHAIITLTGNTTITLTNVTKAFSGNLTVINPATAYTLTFAGYTNMISPAVYSVANQVKTSGSSKIDVFSWWYDGTRLFWNGTNDYK